MADEDDSNIMAALAKLLQENPSAARNAEAAVEWMAGEQGLALVTQERIQNFLWYDLPVKWMTGLDDKLAVVDALARLLDRLGLDRYAAICRSDATQHIVRAYEDSIDAGKSAFRKANAASGIQPPNLPEFQWGIMMGIQEASALSSTADYLELAIAGGELVPGARGWHKRQQELVRAHLNTPSADLPGQSLAQMILTERIEGWLNIRRSETRRTVLAAVANRLLHPADLPLEAAADPLPALSWLLEQLKDGLALTQTGNLNRNFVQGAASRFGWDFPTPPRNEDDLFALHLLRQVAQRVGLVRRAGGKLVLTAKGRGLSNDPEKLWRVTAHGLLGGDDFSVYAGELFLALVIDNDSIPYSDIKAIVTKATREEGFRNTRTDEPPDEHEVGGAMADTSGIVRALGLISFDGDRSDQDVFGLSDVGNATALEALRARGTGPRTLR